MKKYTVNLLAFGLTLSLMGASTSTIAVEATFADLPKAWKADSVPNNKLFIPFQQTGVIRDLDIAGGKIIISGTRYYYDPNTKFQSAQSNSLSVHSLNKGDRVGISYTVKDKNQRFLTSVSVLPTNLVLPTPLDQ